LWLEDKEKKDRGNEFDKIKEHEDSTKQNEKEYKIRWSKKRMVIEMR
jgi:hypothetical protein